MTELKKHLEELVNEMSPADRALFEKITKMAAEDDYNYEANNQRLVCPNCNSICDIDPNVGLTTCDVCGYDFETKEVPYEYPRVKLINLTPHDINIYTGHCGREIPFTVPKSGKVARCKKVDELENIYYAHEIGISVPVYRAIFGDVVDLPAPQAGVLYIVSRIVKNAVPDRDDVITPGEAVRDDGKIIGCRGLDL